jgi:hypothetical protein
MITMQAVVRTPAIDPDAPPPWAIEPMAPDSWLALDAACTDEQVALFVLSLADPIDVSPPGGPTEVVDALLAQDLLIVAGGLRLGDTATGVAVSPGCCAVWRTGATGRRSSPGRSRCGGQTAAASRKNPAIGRSGRAEQGIPATVTVLAGA